MFIVEALCFEGCFTNDGLRELFCFCRQEAALDIDAKKIDQFKAYNILPLESTGVPNPFQSFAEVRFYFFS